jgi:Na+-transporting NADH:ubiquinone oxidoreductase subunit NqrF
MKREIRDRRNELRETSVRLRKLAWECDYTEERNFKIREKQHEQYKRFNFYDGIIKANEKITRGNNEREITKDN